MTTKMRERAGGLLLLVGALFALSLSFMVIGAPQGAQITSNSTEGLPSNPADSRADDGGTINVLTLNSTQQNSGWKAYVGNVSGRLTLDDASGNTIYDWTIQASNIQGEVYVSRNSSITWSNVSCADQTAIDTEQSLLNMQSSDSDSLNSTFSNTAHASMQVGVNSISQDSCRSTATYVNDSSQVVSNTSAFQEILLQDQNSVFMYATFIDQDEFNYKTGNETYDFQLIVGEDDQSGTPTTYFFYMEVS